MYEDCVCNGSNLCKCIGNVHKLAQYNKNYTPYDVTITVSSMILYYLGYVARHDSSQFAHLRV